MYHEGAHNENSFDSPLLLIQLLNIAMKKKKGKVVPVSE